MSFFSTFCPLENDLIQLFSVKMYSNPHLGKMEAPGPTAWSTWIVWGRDVVFMWRGRAGEGLYYYDRIEGRSGS